MYAGECEIFKLLEWIAIPRNEDLKMKEILISCVFQGECQYDDDCAQDKACEVRK